MTTTRTVIGPPFYGFNVWQDLTTEGEWSAVKFFPSTGQVVVQVAAKPTAPYPTRRAVDYADVFRGRTAEADGTYVLNAAVDVGPVTMLRRGAQSIDVQVAIYFADNGGSSWDQHTFTTTAPIVGARYGVQMLSATRSYKKGTFFEVGLFTRAQILYSGNPDPAPYAEIIATYQSVQLVTIAAIAAAPEGATEEKLELPRLVSPGRGKAQPIALGEPGRSIEIVSGRDRA